MMKTGNDKSKRKPEQPRFLNNHFRITLFAVIILSLTLFTGVWMKSQKTLQPPYTLNEVLVAYEAGQFRVIQTSGTYPVLSPDGQFVVSMSDALYHVDDGLFDDALSHIQFSPDGNYAYQRADAIYRMPHLDPVVPLILEAIPWGDGEYVTTGNVLFSNDGQYVAVTGAGNYYREQAELQDVTAYGVYRLSDGHQIIVSDSFLITFSEDSQYVSMEEGTYHLPDGQRIGEWMRISPDSTYGTSPESGVIRLSDGAQIIPPVDERTWAYFTPDSQYVVIYGDGLYRLSDAQLLLDLPGWVPYERHPFVSSHNDYIAIPVNLYTDAIERPSTFVYSFASQTVVYEVPPSYGEIRFSPDGLHMAHRDDNGFAYVYRLNDMQQIFELESTYWLEFSPDGQYLSVDRDGIYHIADGEHLFDTRGVFSSDSNLVAIEDDGVYRLSDGAKLIDIQGRAISFIENDTFLVTQTEWGYEGHPRLYRISDGAYYDYINILDVEQGILYVGNSILVIDWTQRVSALAFIQTTGGTIGTFAVFDETDDAYLVEYHGELHWRNRDSAIRFTIP